jgi:hypothetical protein
MSYLIRRSLVHSDPVGSELTPATDPGKFASEDMLARPAREGLRRGGVRDEEPETAADEGEEDDEGDEPAPVVREGLPARFRMRHTPHYVDELLGGTPLRTVREIPLAEIESPTDDRAELDDLERSIRRFGVIEPLLVGRPGPPHRVIAGMRRLRAAQRIGLDTVPCLVHEVDDDRLVAMRDAATQRVTVPPPPSQREPEAPTPAASPAPAEPAQQPMIGEAVLGLEFVSALLPAMSAARNDRLRWGVLADLAAVEFSRTKALGAALQILGSGSAIARRAVDPLTLIGDVVSAATTEARLRGVRVEVSWPQSGAGSGLELAIDGARCRDALTGLLQSLLALAPRAGTVLSLNPQMTNIRPALIFQALLHESDPELSPEALARFFEAGWREHPCGTTGGAMLAALAQTARAHGGRVNVKAAGQGCLVMFVVPRVEG